MSHVENCSFQNAKQMVPNKSGSFKLKVTSRDHLARQTPIAVGLIVVVLENVTL